MPNALYIGFGEFGRRLAISITEMYINEKKLMESRTGTIKPLFCYDFYPETILLQELERHGLVRITSDNVIIPEAERASGYIPVAHILPSPASIAVSAGVGSFWPLAARSVVEHAGRSSSTLERDGDDPLGFRRIERARAQINHDVFIFAASCAGGTGNGSCPEFARLYLSSLSRRGIAPPRILPIAVTVLPFKNDPRLHIAEPNTLTFLGRIVTSGVKTVFVADNEHFYRMGEGTAKAEETVNELLAHALASLLLMEYAVARRWEAADFVNFFAIPDRASITVPAFCQIDPKEFTRRTLDLRMYIPFILQSEIRRGLAAEIYLESRPPKRALVIVALPEGLQLSDSVIGSIEKGLNGMLAGLCTEKFNVTIIRDAPISNVWVAAYFVEPYIPRLREMYSRASRFLTSEDSIREHIQRMLGTIGMSPDMLKDAESFIELIRNSYESFTRYFHHYTAGNGFHSEHNPFPYIIMRASPPSSPSRKTRDLKVNIGLVPENVLRTEEEFIVFIHSESSNITRRSFIIREYSDRRIIEMIKDAIKILKDDIGELRRVKIEPFRATISIMGREIPLPPEALQYYVAELPEDSKIAIYLPAVTDQEKR